MWLPLVSVAWAGAYPDAAAFWTGSRWRLAIEETTPTPVELSAEDNYSFRTRAMQVEAVLDCPSAVPAGKLLEVTCAITAFAIRATPRTLAHAEALNPGNQKVLESIVERMTGQQLLIRLGLDGRVLTVDLPSLQATNRRESESREVLRRMAFDLVAGFHLRHGADWQSGWQEKNSALLRAPTQPGGSGLSQVRHSVSQVDGSTIVQSDGKGTFTSPYEPWQFSHEGRMYDRGTNSGSVGGVPTGGTSAPSEGTTIDDGRLMSVGSSAPSSAPTDYTFTGTLTSVAVVDPTLGLPTERLWATLGRPNASSIGNMQGLSVYYTGSLARVGATDPVQLGATEIVAPPGQKLDGIGVWVPMAVL